MLSQKSPISSPPTPLPTHSHFLALTFPCTEAYKVCKTKGPLFPMMADTHGGTYRDKVWSWDRKMDHLETATPGDPSHDQPPNADTIACTSKFLLKGPWYSCLLWGYASAWQIQKWMLTVIYRMEHRAPNGGARESTQGSEGVCNSIDGTTIWTNQYPQSLCL